MNKAVFLYGTTLIVLLTTSSCGKTTNTMRMLTKEDPCEDLCPEFCDFEEADLDDGPLCGCEIWDKKYSYTSFLL